MKSFAIVLTIFSIPRQTTVYIYINVAIAYQINFMIVKWMWKMMNFVTKKHKGMQYGTPESLC